MKKYLFLLLAFFFCSTNVFALDSFCWNPTNGELNAQLKTNEYGCGPSTCLDDDGITPYCVNTTLGGTISYRSSTNGSYPMGQLSNINGFYAQSGYSDVIFNFNIPVWRDPILKSITISSKGNDGTTQWHEGYVPMTFNYCTNSGIKLNSSNFSNMYFDGYEELPINKMDFPYAEGFCYKVYVRVKVRIFYFLPNQYNAVPVELSSYYYMSSVNNTFVQFYNNATWTPVIVVNDLKYLTHNDYIAALDEINYRNYQNNIYDIQSQYQQSQNQYIKDIHDYIAKYHEDVASNECGILCKLKGIWYGITNLPEFIGEVIKRLFVPSEDQLYEIINDSKKLSENFGFVGQSTNFFISIFTSMLGMVNSNGCLEFPEFTIGKTSLFDSITFWEARQVCLADNIILSTHINTIRTITSVVLVCMFITFAGRQFFRILDKSSVDTGGVS